MDKEQINDKKENFYSSLLTKLLFAAIGLLITSIISFIVIRNDYTLYFSDNGYQYSTTIVDTPPSGSFVTTVKYDNTYINDNIKTENDAINLIISDSDLQKEKCTNEEVMKIESRIQEKYNIVAINLCELDTQFALEIEKIVNRVYTEFPSVSGYMTNLTLMNATDINAPLATFNYGFLFSTSSKNRGYPWVIKNQIIMNSNYFLDQLTFENAITNATRNGYFPKNATKYSIVAHEFGHYLSFVALNKNYDVNERFLIKKMNYSSYYKVMSDYSSGVLAQKIIGQAFKNYNAKNPNIYIDELSFRNSISDYAVVMDGQGKYIYDETIAEAFHDYYINGDNATDASKEIIKVLKTYLK